MTAGGSGRTCRRDPSTDRTRDWRDLFDWLLGGRSWNSPWRGWEGSGCGLVDRVSSFLLGPSRLATTGQRLKRHPVSLQFLLVSRGHRCYFLPVLVTSDLLNDASGNRRYGLAPTERAPLSSAAGQMLRLLRDLSISQCLALTSQAEAELNKEDGMDRKARSSLHFSNNRINTSCFGSIN